MVEFLFFHQSSRFLLTVFLTLIAGVILLRYCTSYVHRSSSHLRNNSSKVVIIGVVSLIVIGLGVIGMVAVLQFSNGFIGGLLATIVFSIVLSYILGLGSILSGMVIQEYTMGVSKPPNWISLVFGTVSLNLLFLFPGINYIVLLVLIVTVVGVTIHVFWTSCCN